MARTCIYCGSRADSREHALPGWLESATPHKGDLIAEGVTRGLVSGPVKTFDSNPYELKVRAVCETCNTGWMHDLETTAKPWLLPLLTGSPRSLPPFAESIVAAWMFKTFRMMQLATMDRNERDPVPPEHDSILYQRGVAPFNVSVRVGRSVLSEARPFFRYGWHPDVTLVNELTGASEQGDVYGGTIAIGRFVAQVEGSTFRDLRLSTAPGVHLVSRFIEIWPTLDGPIQWPPPDTFDDAMLFQVAGELIETFRRLPMASDEVRKRHPPKGVN